MFQTGPFQRDIFSDSPQRQLGISFSDLRSTWDQYAPEVRTDLKAVRDAAFSTPVAAPGAPVSSPTNLAYKPAPSSGIPTGLLVVGGLLAAGGAAYYFYTKKK
jgi:hypothetical protein